jgi:hypothetical protein
VKIATAPAPDRLYELLPAMYRETDAEGGYPLRALLRLLNAQADLLRRDAEQLNDDSFIETAEQWAIPYLGALVGNVALNDVDMAAASATAEALFDDLVGPNLRPIAAIRARADVAKTIYYRRRKGTPAMLEELARDVTGWPAHVVEFFERLNWTQNLEHVRLASTDAPDLRRASFRDHVQGPFDDASHTVDVRRIAASEGWYGIRNVGFFLWRLRDYPVEGVTARIIGPAWRRTFSPIGASAPLFAARRREASTSGLTTEPDVPAPIRSAAFLDELAAGSGPSAGRLYGDFQTSADAALAVYEDGVLVDPAKIACRNLGRWDTATQPVDDRISIDVARGRLVVGAARPSKPITVAYRYGFSADLGGGPYERGKWLIDPARYERRISVGPAGSGADESTLSAALNSWATNHRAEATLIEILDSGTYQVSQTLDLHPTKSLAIQAATKARPHVQVVGGELLVDGPQPGATLTLSGLLIEGGLRVAQEVRAIRVLHSTLVPGRRARGFGGGPSTEPSIEIVADRGGHVINTEARVEIAFSVTGPIRMSADSIGLWLLDSIVDSPIVTGRRGLAIGDGKPDADTSASGPPATIERSTILGASRFRILELGSESIFAGKVTATRTDEGCVRFSYLAPGSRTPQEFRCQPALAEAAAIAAAQAAAATAGGVLTAPARALVSAAAARATQPAFTSMESGQPAYCQLTSGTLPAIRTGAEDGSEMGAFNHLKQAQREGNLRLRLDEYLPFGLDAGLIFVT